jgi:hypothetical protein
MKIFVSVANVEFSIDIEPEKRVADLITMAQKEYKRRLKTEITIGVLVSAKTVLHANDHVSIICNQSLLSPIYCVGVSDQGWNTRDCHDC